MATNQSGVRPPLAVSTSAFARELREAQWDALDASGIDALEVVGPAPQCPLDEPAYLQKTRRRLQRARIRLHSVHLTYGRRQDLSQPDEGARVEAVAITEANLRLAAALGATLAVVHPSAEPIPDEARRTRLDASRRSLEQLARTARTEGVRLAVECLPRSCLGNTAAELAALVAPLDPDVIGVCIDVNHLNLREPDIAAGVAALAPRLLTLHCSDNDGLDERHWLPGDARGVIDWRAFLGALDAAGYTGPFLYEVRQLDPDPAVTLRQIEENYSGFVLKQRSEEGHEDR